MRLLFQWWIFFCSVDWTLHTFDDTFAAQVSELTFVHHNFCLFKHTRLRVVHRQQEFEALLVFFVNILLFAWMVLHFWPIHGFRNCLRYRYIFVTPLYLCVEKHVDISQDF